MRVKGVSVRNYRSLRDVTVCLDGLTTLIGPNGAGKTSVLTALNLFSADAPPVTADDFNDVEEKIQVDLTLSGAKPDGPLAPHVIGGEICLRREWKPPNDQDRARAKPAQASYVRTRLNADFDGLRGMTRKTEIVPAIKALKEQEGYQGIPACDSDAKEWKPRFLEYERDFCARHPDLATIRLEYVAWDAGLGQMKELLDIVYIPAMRDITDDGSDSSGSYLGRLMDMAIEYSWSANPDVAAAVEGSILAYERYFDLVKKTIVPPLDARLNEKTRRFAKNASIKVNLGEPPASVPPPRTSITLYEDGRETDIGRVGGGLQRIYLMALLETISEQRSKALDRAPGRRADPRAGRRARLIVIDEPELYQHPQRQRRMLHKLIELAGSPLEMQVLCSTHSPYFIELSRIDGLRLLRKDKSTSVHVAKRGDIMEPILDSYKTDLSGDDALDRWLDVVASHWITEGLFSRLAVLVEGPEDRNVLLATASLLGVDLNEHEISIVPVHGKRKMRAVAHLFMPFGIPLYPVWDLDPGSDEPDNEQVNDGLFGLVGHGGEERAASPGITGRYACFERNFTAALRDDLVRHEKLLHSDRWGGLVADLRESRKTDSVSKALKERLGARDVVYDILWDVHSADPDALWSFDSAKIVRYLEEIGKGNEPAPILHAKGRSGGAR